VAGLWKELFFRDYYGYVEPRYRKSNRSHGMGTNGLSPSIEARPSTKISSGALPGHGPLSMAIYASIVTSSPFGPKVEQN
jgi:hypothetical protein